MRWAIGFAMVVGALSACGSERTECTQAQESCLDRTTKSACIDGALVRLPCRGAGGCTGEGAASRCDQSVAAVGDACGSGNACSADQRQFLQCREGAFVLFSACEMCAVGERAECIGPTFPPGSVGAE